MNKRSGFKVMSKLVGLVKPLAPYMVLAIIMGLIGNLCATMITVFGGYAILDVLKVDIPMSLTVIFVCLGTFALLRGILRYAEQSCNHFIAFKLLALIRSKVFKSLRRLCPAKLEVKEKGNLISVITSDIELLEVFYAHTISPIAIAILFIIAMTLFIGHYHWLLGLIALASYIIIGFVMPLIISKLSGNAGMEFRQKSGHLSSIILDSLRGLPELIQYDKTADRIEYMNKKTDELSETEGKMKGMAGRNAAITGTVVMLLDFLMLYMCCILFKMGITGFDAVIIPTIALFSSFGPCMALSALGSTLQNTFAAGNRVLDILEDTPVVEDIENREHTEFNGAKAKNVSFSYDTEQILTDVSVDIPKNSIIGISGRSGSGKSTLLKLFMRFYNPNKGELLISSRKTDEINTSDLRQMESFMTQTTYLFNDTIKNNLKIAKLDATDEEIILACKKASVHEFIKSLPEGYDTNIGELGDSLSGGEKQRLGLARAFLHDAPFMLLDEPTSNLDSLNEAVILKSLYEQRKGKTVVLVSHRKSTMKIADKIYSVEHGRLS